MVDVTVDAKPTAKLPYDPNDIPEAVRKRVAAVEALYGPPKPPHEAEKSSEPEKPKEPVVEPSPTPAEAPPPQAAEPAVQTPPTAFPPPPAEPPSPPPENENSETWKSRYYGLQGRFTAAQKTIGEMQEQMTQLGNEVLQAQQLISRNSQTQPPPPLPSYLTDQDVQNYGTDLVDFTQRAAAQAIAPKLQQIEQQNAELQKRLAREARFRLDQSVELAVPNYREVDMDPRWRRWLLGVDLFSGRVRQQLLNEAIASASAPRVISFFKGFLQEEAATGHSEPAPSSRQAEPVREPAVPLASLAAPGRARPATGGDASVPSDKPTYTRAQIAQNYSLHRKGAFVGRETEWDRLERDMIAAPREGRMR